MGESLTITLTSAGVQGLHIAVSPTTILGALKWTDSYLSGEFT